MFKLAVVLLAASAVYAIPPEESWKRQQDHVQTMAIKIREVSNTVVDSIQNTQVDTQQARRALLEQINEFSHSIQNIFYEMQQIVQNTEGEEKKALQQIAQQLSETTYTLQQAMNAEPFQMKNKLKEQVQRMATESEKLALHLQQKQKPQREQDDNMKAMKRTMMDLHVAIKKLETELKNKDRSNQEIYNKMHELANEINTQTQKVQDDDEQSVQEFADFVQRLCQQMNTMIDKLQREANDQFGQTRNSMQQVANRMSEMRTNLEKAVNTQGNTQEKARNLKEELNRTMRDAAVEIQNLMQLAQHSNEQGKAVIKDVMVDGVAVAEDTKAQLRVFVIYK